MAEMKGGCLCGAVRFSAANVETAFEVCHCGMCRRWAGSPLFAATAERVTFENRDSLGVYDSSEWAARGFCSKCGSSLFYYLKPADQLRHVRRRVRRRLRVSPRRRNLHRSQTARLRLRRQPAQTDRSRSPRQVAPSRSRKPPPVESREPLYSGRRPRIIHERRNVSAKSRLGGRAFQDRAKQGCFARSPHGWVHGVPEKPSLPAETSPTTNLNRS